jgi:5-methylcytosine-specific restriction endonuclease McrA
MASALRPGGSTWAWRKLRAQWALRLAQAGQLPCPRCGQPIRPSDPWNLDHLTPRARGGSDDSCRPSHRSCDAAAGARLRQQLARERTAPRAPMSSAW